MVVGLQNKNSYYGQDILKISSFVSSHFENPKVDFAGNISVKVIHTRSEFSMYNVIEFPCYSEILTCGNGVIILR